MKTTEIIAQAARRGLRIEVHGNDLAVSATGAKPVALLAAIRARKAAIIAELKGDGRQTCEEGEESEKSSKHGLQLPPSDLPLPQGIIALGAAERAGLIEQVIAQGMLAVAWCLARANQYYEQFPNSSFEDQDSAAAADLLTWQEQAQLRN